MTLCRRLLLVGVTVLVLVAPVEGATRTYQRPDLRDLQPRHLATQIDAALARSGTQVDVAGLTVSVTHPALVAGDDPAVQALVNAYTFNKDFGLLVEALALRNTVPTLRLWATQADTAAADLGAAIANWDSQTTAQRFVTLKATLGGLQTLTTRLGRLCDRLADVLTAEGLNGP